MSTEKDPTGKKLGEMGTKLDAGKAPVMRGCFHYFPRALKAVAMVSAAGAAKGYAWKSWETVPEGVERYGDALGRHILDEAIDGRWDIGTGGISVLHAAQDAWNALARLELMLKQGAPLFNEIVKTLEENK